MWYLALPPDPDPKTTHPRTQHTLIHHTHAHTTHAYTHQQRQVKESKAEDTDADAAPLKLNPNAPKAKFMPRVHQASSIKKGTCMAAINVICICDKSHTHMKCI